jgi:Flp pilus assembly protein TadD
VSALERVFHLVDLGRMEEARREAERSLATNPRDAHMMSLLAAAVGELEGPKPALRIVEDALAIDHQDPHLFSQRGVYLSKLGKHVPAYESFNVALGLDPTHQFSLFAYVEAILRHPKMEGSRPPRALVAKARELANMALEAYPSEVGSHLIDAKLLVATGKNQQARDSARRALAIDPNNSVAHQLMGLANQRMGNVRAAGDSYVTAAKVDPNSGAPDLLRGLTRRKAVPIVFLAFVLMRLIPRLLSFGQETAGSSAAVVIVLAVVVGPIVLILMNDSRDASKDELSPQAQAILDQDRTL